LVTMKDIAILVGVSRQAVSSALNNNDNCRVSEAKRREIKRAARELNYVSNSAALSLKGAPSKIIGFMGPLGGAGLTSTLTTEISQMLIAKGYNILYNEYNWSNRGATEALLNLLARGVDGIIVYCSEEAKIFEVNQTVPYLFFSHNNAAFMDVGVDNEYGGYLATKHLLEHGHEKAALLIIREYKKQNAKLRGWRRAHREAGIRISDEDIIILRELNGSVEKAVAYIKDKKFTAIFAANDFIAAKLIKILTQRQIRVPEDIAVIGYDGYTFCEFTPSSLTTVIQPLREQAEFGVKLLLERIKNKELHSPPAGHLLKPVLYRGGSCGCKPKIIKNFYQINTFDMLEEDAKINFNIDILNS